MVFNVACGSDHSVMDVAEGIRSILGGEIEPVHGPKRPGDVMRTFADISMLRNVLKVEPGVDFHEGLRRTVEWFADNYKLQEKAE